MSPHQLLGSPWFRGPASQAQDTGLGLGVHADARAAGALTGYDPNYGARPLRRLVQSAIGDPLAANCSPANSPKETPSWWT